MKNLCIATSILFGVCLAASPSYAQTVKKWVDEDGVTHYSDQKPAGAEGEVKEIDVPDANVTEFESEAASERIQKQLQQLEQDREAREAEAKAKEEARALEESLEREPLVVEEKKKKKDRSSRKTPYPIQVPTLPKAPNPLKPKPAQ